MFNPPPPPPVNNLCGSPTSLTVNSTCVFTNATTDGATQSFPGCAGNADDDEWFTFTATNSLQNITVSPIDNLDLVFQVYSGNCGSTMTPLLCEDNTFGGQVEQSDIVGLVPGQPYRIRVYDYYAGATGDFQICVSGTPTPTPTNDEPCNAIQMPDVTSTCQFSQFTTVGSTASTGTPTPSSCIGGSGAAIGGFSAASHDVWFAVTVPSSGNIDVTSQPAGGVGSISDGVMVLYTGTCAALTQVVCSDDHNYPGAPSDLLPFISASGLTPGSTVYIRYFGFGSSSGTFGICVSTATNDDCVNALYICDLNGYSASTSASYTEDRPGTGAGQMFANNENAAGVNQPNGIDTGGPFGDGNPWDASYSFTGSPALDVNIDNNSWIEFTASATTATLGVQVFDCFTNSGIQMQVFSNNNCDNFVPVSNFEESNTGFTITAVGLTVGSNYLLMVDGFAGDICNYTITAQSGVQFPDIDTVLNCLGGTIDLIAPSGASSYFWPHSGETTATVTVTPAITENYSVEVTGLCDYKQTLTVTVGANTCSPLPVELLFFNINRINERNIGIHWATNSEINSDYFEVERSSNGSAFSPILKQDAAGNSIQVINYNDNDSSPLKETSYYRLKQVDFDGAFTYSNVLRLDNSSVEYKVYPNPSSGVLSINLSSKKAKESTLFVYNNLGQVVYEEVLSISKGNSTYTFDLSDVKRGLYQLKVIEEDGSFEQQKIILD